MNDDTKSLIYMILIITLGTVGCIGVRINSKLVVICSVLSAVFIGIFLQPLANLVGSAKE